MFENSMILGFAIFIFFIAIIGYIQEITSNRAVSKKLIGKLDSSSWIKESFKVSPDSNHFTYVAEVGNKMFVVVDGKEEKEYDGIGEGPLIFSPDSRHLAYGARVGNKRFVVLDGKEEKEYHGIAKGSLIFSPDSNHLAYGSQIGNKSFVVVDGKEEKEYDSIVSIGEGRIIFDSPDGLHYLALKDDNFYLVEEKIVM